MGTVGISFGSPTSGQGFDVTTTVASIVANLQAVETPWKNQLTSLQSQDTALTSIGTDLSTLSTAVESLTDFEGVLAGKQGSSSNTDVLALTSAGTTAVAGGHTVVVNSLAATASYYSDAIANANDLLTGSFTVTVNGVAQTIAASSSGETLDDLVATINGANAGVTASVVNSSGGEELSLVSNTSGAAGNFTMFGSLTDSSNDNASIALDHVGQTGVDASLNVDGIALTSASNTVTNAIQGVTFQLLDAAPDSPVQIEITNDNSSVESAVSSFVSAYNTVIGDINTQEGNDSSGDPEPLYGSPALSTLQEQLQSALIFAQTPQAVSTTGVIAPTDSLSGNLSISVGGGTAQTISTDAGGDTLSQLATKINAANLGVTASVITSGDLVTISLQNSVSGSNGAITVAGSGLTDTTSGSAVDFGSPQTNAVTSITQLGISVNNDGTLTLDNDTLDSILNSNYQDVVNFLQPSGTFTSFGGNLTNTLTNLGNSAPDGAIYLALQQDSQEETSLNDNITNENTIISNQQTQLTTELNEANYELEQIPTQLDEINEIYSSITGYNQDPS